jgi:general secretion pathway protein I
MRTEGEVLDRKGASRASGFTLIEVMVALAVVAVALPALLITLSQQLDGMRYLEHRAHAQWVAANRLADLTLVLAANGTLQSGLISGSEDLAGQTWYWWSEGEQTPVPGFYRYRITVSDQEDGRLTPLHALDGYLAQKTDDAF